jgi:hypothetical protein
MPLLIRIKIGTALATVPTRSSGRCLLFDSKIKQLDGIAVRANGLIA